MNTPLLHQGLERQSEQHSSDQKPMIVESCDSTQKNAELNLCQDMKSCNRQSIDFVEQRPPKKKCKMFQKIPFAFPCLDGLDQMIYRDNVASSLIDILSKMIADNDTCISLSRRLIKYDQETNSKSYYVKDPSVTLSYRDVYNNFWVSFCGTIRNIGDDMTRIENRSFRSGISSNTDSTTSSPITRSSIIITRLLRSTQEQRSVINRYIKMCHIYKHCTDILYSVGQYARMMEVIDEFMSQYISSLLCLVVCDADQIHMHHIYTSIKRWNKVKTNYITDLSTKSDLTYRYMRAMMMMLNKGFDQQQITIVTALYLNHYVQKDQNQTQGTHTQNDTLIKSVFETSVRGGWVRLIDVFRLMVDLSPYVDHSIGVTVKLLNTTKSDKFRWMLRMDDSDE